jgi:predicted RNA-binding Zn-ribbon protein involved in translation (DUF1610 family)
MGTCPHCQESVVVRAELVAPEAYDDDNVASAEESTIQLEQGARTFQYVCPACDAILGAGTHKWAR